MSAAPAENILMFPGGKTILIPLDRKGRNHYIPLFFAGARPPVRAAPAAADTDCAAASRF